MYGNDASNTFRGKNEPVLEFYGLGFNPINPSLAVSLKSRVGGGGPISHWTVKAPELVTHGTFIPELGSMGFLSIRKEYKNKEEKISYISNVSFQSDKFRAHAFNSYYDSQKIDTLELVKVDNSTFKGSLDFTRRHRSETFGDYEKIANAEIECNIPENDWVKLRERFEKEYNEKINYDKVTQKMVQ